MALRQRLDAAVVERGLAPTRAKAQALIMAGAVRINDTVVSKAGAPVPADAIITVTAQCPFVSRGGLKLSAALDHFGADPRGRVCLDIGASTGGFTDCLLQRGARLVYAVDVGRAQLHERLRMDPRVVSLEGINFRHCEPASLKERAEFVTIDVSFISLDKIFPALPRFLAPGAIVIAMVKPQFEVGRGGAPKGVVRDQKQRVAAIARVSAVAAAAGFTNRSGVDSTVPGPKGNIEHFLYLTYEDQPA